MGYDLWRMLSDPPFERKHFMVLGKCTIFLCKETRAQNNSTIHLRSNIYIYIYMKQKNARPLLTPKWLVSQPEDKMSLNPEINFPKHQPLIIAMCAHRMGCGNERQNSSQHEPTRSGFPKESFPDFHVGPFLNFLSQPEPSRLFLFGSF